MDETEPRDTLDMTDQQWRGDGFWNVCKTFEQIVSGGKLHQYLRILVKAGVLDIAHENDDDLLKIFLSRSDLHTIAHDAWETQPVLVSVRSGVNVHNLASHVRCVIKNHLSDEFATRKAIEHFRIEDPSSEVAQRLIGLARLPITALALRSPHHLEQRGYTRVGHFLGVGKDDLLGINGIGEKTADAILEAMRELFTPHSRAISHGKRLK